MLKSVSTGKSVVVVALLSVLAMILNGCASCDTDKAADCGTTYAANLASCAAVTTYSTCIKDENCCEEDADNGGGTISEYIDTLVTSMNAASCTAAGTPAENKC